ncbi:MAG: transposase, partial [Candidatus Bathyarchaeia archaeon]
LNGRRQYTKIHGLFNLETGTVEAFEATKGTAHECSHLKGLLSRLENIECLVADPAYLSRRKLHASRREGGTPYIKHKKNSQMKAKGCWPWKNTITLFQKHQRIEAGWHSLKSLVGDLVRNRTVQTIKTEMVKSNLLQLILTIRGGYKF